MVDGLSRPNRRHRFTGEFPFRAKPYLTHKLPSRTEKQVKPTNGRTKSSDVGSSSPGDTPSGSCVALAENEIGVKRSNSR